MLTTRLRGYALASFAIVGLGVGVQLYDRRAQWWGSGRLLITEVRDAATIAMLVLPVATAFWASQLRRRRMDVLERVSPRARRGVVERILVVAGAATLAVLVACALSLVSTGASRAPGSVPWLWLLPAVLNCWLSAALGYAIGTGVRWPALSLLLAPGGWVVIWGFFSRAPGLVLLQGSDTSVTPFTVEFVLLQAGFFGCAALITTAFAARAQWRPSTLFALVLLTTASGAVLATTPPRGFRVLDDAAARSTCVPVTAAVDFCSAAAESARQAEWARWSAEVVRAAGPLAGHLEHVVTPRTLAADRRGELPPGTVVFQPLAGFEGALLANRSDTEANLLLAVVNPQSCPLSDGSTTTTMGAVLSGLAHELGVNLLQGASRTAGPPVDSRHEELDPHRWPAEQVERLQQCEL